MLRGKTLLNFRKIWFESFPTTSTYLTSKRLQKCLYSTSKKLNSKIFHDNENKYAHDVLVNSLRDYQIFQPIKIELNNLNSLPHSILNPPDKSSYEPNQVFEDFKTLILFCRDKSVCISEDQFDEFTDLFCVACYKFSDQQLIDCLALLRLLPITESTRTKNFCEIWNSLDHVCLQRVDQWRDKELLLISDAWYQLGLARICQFIRPALRKMGRRVTKMTTEEMLHSMFFCNIVRRPLIEMFEYEVNFNRLIDEMTINEIGVMSMGFFKTQTPIRNADLIDKIYHRLIESVDTVEDITLVAILKILRYSSKIPQADLMTKLLDSLVPQIQRISILSCLHVSLLGSDIQTCHDDTMELIIKRFIKEIDSSLRLKEMERICHVISLFNYQSPEGLEKVLCGKIVKKVKENMADNVQYPRCFSNCVHYLTLCGFPDEEMISAVLDTKFIRHAYDTNLRAARELFLIDSFVKINLKDSYNGNQLPEKYRRTMGRLLTHYIPERNPKYKLSTTDRILLEIKETTDNFLKLSTFKHVLPHFERPDIVFCYDNVKKVAIPLSPDCPEDYIGAILGRKELLGDKSDDPNLVTVAVAVGGWNNAVRGKDRPTGSFQMKLNQLNLLGHKNCVIYWHEWRHMETHADRQNLLKRKLNAILR